MNPSLRAASPRTLVLGLLLTACHTNPPATPRAVEPDLGAAVRAELELPVSSPPHEGLAAQWKERLDERYAYIELVGSYTETARALGGVLRELASRGVEPSGPPFALFFDDPARTNVSQLRSRACVPVGCDVELPLPYAIDVLPSALVVYGYVGGPYSDVPRAYPGLYAFMKKLGWAEAGPVREIYLVAPGSVRDWAELVTEVQIPAQPTR